MPIALPLTPGPNSAEPYFVDAGGWQKPTTVGDPTRIDLLGDRFGLSVTMPPMEEAAALVWVGRLNRGRGAEVSFQWPQYRLPAIARPTAAIGAASVAQATVIQIKNLLNSTIEEGRFFSVNSGGRNYMHQAAAETVIAASGGLLVHPRSRKAYSIDDLVDFDTPTIDGILEGDQNSWTISTAMHYGLAFDIVEGR